MEERGNESNLKAVRDKGGEVDEPRCRTASTSSDFQTLSFNLLVFVFNVSFNQEQFSHTASLLITCVSKLIWAS